MNTFTWNTTSEIDTRLFLPKDVFAAGMKHHTIANTAWPIAHGKTLREYRVPKEDHEQHMIRTWNSVQDMCLYVHVPFCEKLCKFCDYAVMNPAIREEQEPKYFQMLSQELDMYRQKIGTQTKNLLGFDIGGGTPSAVDTKYIWSIMEQVRANFSLVPGMNISIETTPKIAALSPQKIHEYHQMGIGRISMWVQTIAPESIGRESTSMKWNHEAAEHIRDAGFDQFNVDLMYGFANQTMEHVQTSIEHVLSLNPEFITLYRMRYKQTNVEEKASQVDISEVHNQYFRAKELLSEAGYVGRNGKNTFSRLDGNDGLSDYLHHRVERAVPYLWVWMGAQSFHPGGSLSYNGGAAVKHPDFYYRHIQEGKLPVESTHVLSREAAMAKMISVSFYSGWIHYESFEKTFGIALHDAFPEEVRFVLENAYMEKNESYGTLQLTELGAQYSNGVIALFYNGAVKKHLLELDENAWIRWKQISRPIQTKFTR